MSMFAKLKNDSRGNVLMIFALCIVPILTVAGFAIDFQQTVKRKGKVQVVLDSAVLAAARVKQTGATDDAVKQSVQDFMDAQIDGLGGLTCDPAVVVVTQNEEEIDANITCKQDTYLIRVIGRDQVTFNVASGSEYGIDKIDVAFMFDISGSMNSASRLTNLKSAAEEAVDVLLPDGASQELLDNTRLAMVSYNAMVNAGDFFEDVAGVTPTRTYTHDLVVTVEGSDESDTGNEFDDIKIGLYDASSNDLITYFGDNAVLAVDPEHMDNITVAVTIPTGSDFYHDHDSVFLRVRGEAEHEHTENAEPYALYSDNGGNYDGEDWDYGEYRMRFIIYDGANGGGDELFNERIEFELVEAIEEVTETETKTYTLTSTCVWERDGDEKFTDGAPAEGAYLAHQQAWFVEDPDQDDGGDWKVGHPNRVDNGRYDGDECRSAEPVELTNNKTTLDTYITLLNAGGYTAGHLGVAWTWYLVSEDWNQVFDGTAAPLDYSEPDSAKVVILMTDGAFNTEVFPEQGNSATQARALCDNMKARDIKVYSVALNAPTAGKEVLSYCASGTDYYFEPETGAELTDAYKQIAISISDLRISK
ncbi:MAG: TadE/TadG family type IV pilus assembly protein [Pseudomonadota bacterium]